MWSLAKGNKQKPELENKNNPLDDDKKSKDCAHTYTSKTKQNDIIEQFSVFPGSLFTNISR